MKELGLMLVLLLVWSGASVQGCGGFFCFNAQPVEQTGEKILFVVDDLEETVSAHIQIQYQGPSEDFSWILPLLSVPTLSVGSDLVFSLLESATNPRYELTWDSSECTEALGCDVFPYAVDEAEGGDGDGGSGDVTILVEGAVGPFNFQVIFGTNSTSLVNWLNDNGYDQPANAESAIEYYVDMGYVFLALKLRKDKDVGDLQPIVATYSSKGALSCVPLVLTAVATAPELPVWIWVIGKSRAIPINYFNIELDERNSPWLECDGIDEVRFDFPSDCSTAYYNQVLESTRNSNGHGFVTEYAGDSDVIDFNALNIDFDKEALLDAKTPAIYLTEMLRQGIPQTTLVQEMVRTAIPKPTSGLPSECESDASFYNIDNINGCVEYIDDDWCFRNDVLTEDIETRLIKPLDAIAEEFEQHRYLTRLMTIMTPEDMTKDPIFTFNLNSGAVSNIHTAHAEESHCVITPGSPDIGSYDVKLTLSDNSVLIYNVSRSSDCEEPVYSLVNSSNPSNDILYYYPILENAPEIIGLQEDLNVVEGNMDLIAMPDCPNPPVECAGGYIAYPLGPNCDVNCPGEPGDFVCIDCTPPDYSCNGYVTSSSGDGDNQLNGVESAIIAAVVVGFMIVVLIIIIILLLIFKDKIIALFHKLG